MAGDRFDTEYAPRPMAALDDDEVIDYSQGGQPRPSMYEAPPRSDVPASVRQDYAEYQRRQAADARASNQTIDWSNLEAVRDAYASGRPLVDFSAPPPAPARYDALGRPMARERNRSRNGLR
jgi:hypothetical protein